MIMKKTEVEAVDTESRFVLKMLRTSDYDALNRKIAVTNQMFAHERSREQYGKNMINSPFQTHHLRWDKSRYWDMDDLDIAKTHAQKNNRFLVTEYQRNQKQYKNLTLKDAENDFCNLLNKGLPSATYDIPRKTTLEQWKKKRSDAISVLSGTQKLIPKISSKHDFINFADILSYEMNESQFIGIDCYELSSPTELVNLSKLRQLNSQKQKGETTPFFIGFGHPRVIVRKSYVAGSFSFACFGIDIFSERQTFIENMKPEAIEKMKERKPEDYLYYDSAEGYFNKSPNQEDWYGIDLTRLSLQEISVDEGLTGYQAIVWKNFLKQQEALSSINTKLINKESVIDLVKSRSRWHTFWQQIATATG